MTVSSPTLNSTKPAGVPLGREGVGHEVADRGEHPRDQVGVAGGKVRRPGMGKEEAGLGVDEEDLLDPVDQGVLEDDLGEGTPVRQASTRHRSPRGERLCSIVLLIEATSPASVSAMAFRIAGPSTGKMALAISRGFRRTDSPIALSTVGASARASWRSRPARRAIASGSSSASSSGVAPASSLRSSSRRRRRSGPRISSRSSESSCADGSN